MPPGLGDQILVLGNQVVLASHTGGLLSIDTQGQVLWRKEIAHDPNEAIGRLIRRGDNIVVAQVDGVEQSDSKTGIRISSTPAAGSVSDVDSAGSLAFFVDTTGLHSLKDGSGPLPQLKHLEAVSVTQESVCVTAAGSDSRVTCYSPDTMSVQWTRTLGESISSGHISAPIQDAPRTFVPADWSLAAFSASDGSILWSTRGRGPPVVRVATPDFGLLLWNDEGKLELGDPAT